MNVDDRLRDLRKATAAQLEPSPRLQHRIESSIDARRSFRWIVTVGVAAAAVAVVMVTLSSFRHDSGQRVITRPPTREEFITAANRRCVAYTVEHDKNIPAARTPEAFAVAAESRVSLLQTTIVDTETVGADSQARGVLETALSRLRRGLELAEQTQQLALAGDVDGAVVAFRAQENAVNEAAGVLRAYGAEDCRVPPRP